MVVDGLSSLPKGVVIFCHGSGDSGAGAKAMVEDVVRTTPSSCSSKYKLLRDSGIVIEYPNAKLRPYSLNDGYMMRVWFDRTNGMDPRNPEDTASVEASAAQLNQLIDRCISEQSVPPENIAIGGFSMGGGIALQTAARCKHKLGAVFAMSSYLCDDSWVWSKLEKQQHNNNTTRPMDDSTTASSMNNSTNNSLLLSPIFMAHGSRDDFVPLQWGKSTAEHLERFGGDIHQFLEVPGAGHEVTTSELEELFDFLLLTLLD